MVKLLRFKYDSNTQTAQDVRGFGKQPIAVGAYSSIALKNYNIQLVASLNNMIFTVDETDIKFGFLEDGVTVESLSLVPGTYNYEQIRVMLENGINALTEQNSQNNPKGYRTEVILQNPEASLLFKTYIYPASTYELNNPLYLNVIEQIPGDVDITDPLIYDATAAGTMSSAIIQNGTDEDTPSDIMEGGDTFSFTVLHLGDTGIGATPGTFRFAACFQGNIEETSAWGIGFRPGEYTYANNSPSDQWDSLDVGEIVPQDADVVTYIRSGINVHIFVKRGGANIYNKYITLSRALLADVSSEQSEYLYALGTTGAVIVSNLTYSVSDIGPTEEEILQTGIQCEATMMGLQLGFPSADIIPSTQTDPVTIALNPVNGAVDYKGIMVCINGLDLETYDFATEAQGKTNFLYTIQREAEINQVTVNTASGNLTNEPYIDMNNMTAMNLNNKLSLYFLDTASGQKLSFNYADLLLIVK